MNLLDTHDLPVRFAQERYANWLENGQKGVDKHMVDILAKLNKIPGLATVHCCESHSDEPFKGHFYVLVSATPEAQVIFRDLYAHVQRALITLQVTQKDKLPDAGNFQFIEYAVEIPYHGQTEYIKAPTEGESVFFTGYDMRCPLTFRSKKPFLELFHLHVDCLLARHNIV